MDPKTPIDLPAPLPVSGIAWSGPWTARIAWIADGRWGSWMTTDRTKEGM